MIPELQDVNHNVVDLDYAACVAQSQDVSMWDPKPEFPSWKI
jgi:hypothetical protein